MLGVVPLQPVGYGSQIAVLGNLKALLFWDYSGPQILTPVSKVAFWTTTNDVRTAIATNWNRTLSPNIEFLGTDRLLLSDFDWASNCWRVSEYVIGGTNGAETLTLTNTVTMGDYLSRWGASTRLKSGGAFFCNYEQTGPNINFWTCYRRPYIQVPTLPGTPMAVISDFQTNFWSLPPDNGEIASSNWATVQSSDGTIWVFVIRDSSGCIALIRYRENGTGISLVDYDPIFLSYRSTNGVVGDDGMAPHGELPIIVARWDPYNSRIILHYQKIGFDFRCTNYLAQTAITAVLPDKSKYLISDSVYEVERISELVSVVRPDGVYTWDEWFNPDCSSGSRVLIRGRESPLFSLRVGAGAVSQSGDGWVAYRDPAGAFVITQLPIPDVRPLLNIVKIDSNPPQVKLSWGDPNYILQGSNDLVNWVNVDNQTNPMWFECTDKRFWRLIKSG